MKCPRHQEATMELTDWKPGEGLNPRLRMFQCPLCDTRVYKVPQGFELVQKVKDARV